MSVNQCTIQLKKTLTAFFITAMCLTVRYAVVTEQSLPQ